MTVYFVCWELEANRCILFAERNGAGGKLSRQDSPGLLACTACLTLIALLPAAAAVRGNNYSLIYFTSQSLPSQQQLSRISPCNDAPRTGSNEFVLSFLEHFLSELCKRSYQMVWQATPKAAFFNGAAKYRDRPLVCSGKLHSWKTHMNAGQQREEVQAMKNIKWQNSAGGKELLWRILC